MKRNSPLGPRVALTSHMLPRQIFHLRPAIGLAPSGPVFVVYAFYAYLWKKLHPLVVAEKEHIESMSVSPDHAVSDLPAKFYHCKVGNSPEVVLRLGPVVEIRSVRDCDT
jgi:hypothetical protein